MLSFLSGKKTYILAGVAIIYAVTGYFLGHTDANTTMGMVWAALTAAALRGGISSSK